MEVRPNQRPAAANLVIAMRNHARNIIVLIILLLLASYFFLETFNHALQVVTKHSVDVWCMFVPGPTCDARQHPKETQTGGNVQKAPLANTQEMVGALEHLSVFFIEIDFARR